MEKKNIELGKTAWYMENNAVHSAKVVGINYRKFLESDGFYGDKVCQTTSYDLYGVNRFFYESEIFATKEELIASL